LSSYFLSLGLGSKLSIAVLIDCHPPLARELVSTPSPMSWKALFNLLVLLPPTRRRVLEFTGVKEGNEDE
jgi:hypothetical protein